MRYDREKNRREMTKEQLLAHKREERHTARMIAIAKPILEAFEEKYWHFHPYPDGSWLAHGVQAELRTEDNGCYYSDYMREVRLTFTLTLVMSCYPDGLTGECYSSLDPNWSDDMIARQIERDLIAKRADLIVSRMRTRYWKFRDHLKRNPLDNPDRLEADMWLIKSGSGYSSSGDTLWRVVSISPSRAKIMVQAYEPDATPYKEPERLNKDDWEHATWYATTLAEITAWNTVNRRHTETIEHLQKQMKGKS